MTQRDRFLDQLDIWGTFVLSNLFWILMSLPLITMPIATSGLFYVMSKWVRGKQPEFFHDFFGGIKRKWQGALVIGLMDLVIGGIVVANVIILLRMEDISPLAFVSSSLTLFTGWALGLVNLYVWSLLVISEQPIRKIIQTAFQLALGHPAWSSLILVATLAPIPVSIFILPKMVILFASFSLSAMIACWGTWRIIRQYLPADELAELETLNP